MEDGNYVNDSIKILSLSGYKVELEWFKGKFKWKWLVKVKSVLIGLGVIFVR